MGPPGRPGLPGQDGKPGITAWKVNMNNYNTDDLLIPPSILGKYFFIFLIIIF